MAKTPATLEELLQESIDLTRENNRLLKAMRRDALIAGIVKTLIWAGIIGGSIYFTMEFLAPYLAILKQMESTGTQIDIDGLLQEYRSFIGQ